MNFHLARELTWEIKMRDSPLSKMPDGKKRMAEMILTRGRFYHLAASYELARADFDVALELNPELADKIKEFLANTPE